MTNKNKNIRGGMNGFTLVELLAVIVILAIILVIAVPKVMSIIEDAKMGTLESTAKMIASAAEKQKVQNTVLGKTDAITCDSVAKINKGDYANCSITFEDNTAKVTIEGKGKFDGLYVCNGTKTSAIATNESCNGNCLISDVEKTYKINVDNCVTHLKSVFEEYDETEYTDTDIRELCSNEDSNSDVYIYDYINGFIDGEYVTEEELIEKGVLEVETKNICITEETPESCFTYYRPYKYAVNNVDACSNYISDAVNERFGLDDSATATLCSTGIYEEEYDEGEYETYLIADIFGLLIEEEGYFTEEELIENNVLKKEYSDELTITDYDETCGVDNVVVPNTIDGLNIIKVGGDAFYKEIEVCNDECSTQCDNPDDPNDCYEECFDDCGVELNPLPIKRIRFGENITYIDVWALGGGNLKYVHVENKDAEIGNCAFGYINNIENHNLPDTYQCDDEECNEVCEEVCEYEDCWEDCWCEEE